MFKKLLNKKKFNSKKYNIKKINEEKEEIEEDNSTALSDNTIDKIEENIESLENSNSNCNNKDFSIKINSISAIDMHNPKFAQRNFQLNRRNSIRAVNTVGSIHERRQSVFGLERVVVVSKRLLLFTKLTFV